MTIQHKQIEHPDLFLNGIDFKPYYDAGVKGLSDIDGIYERHGKFIIFEAAVAEGFYVLAVIGVLSSVVAAFYYLRIIKVMFFDEAADPFDSQIDFLNRAVILVSVLFVVFFIVSPDTLIHASRDAAHILFVG